MVLFESILTLVLIAIVLLQVSTTVFHALEQELDWAELAASPPARSELVEG